VWLRRWTRRLHFYLGLYLLCFVWLFSFTGLVLNHPGWNVGRLGAERVETTRQQPVMRPVVTGDLAVARALMREVGISGEIGRIERTAAGDRMRVQVVRPGANHVIDADLAAGQATVSRTDLNAFYAMNALHTFTGVSMDDANLERDWRLTALWSFAMDAVALGLLVLVASGLYLWIRLPAKRRAGLVALGLGTAVCAFFLLGLTGPG
jgi:hypothetical protein